MQDVGRIDEQIGAGLVGVVGEFAAELLQFPLLRLLREIRVRLRCESESGPDQSRAGRVNASARNSTSG